MSFEQALVLQHPIRLLLETRRPRNFTRKHLKFGGVPMFAMRQLLLLATLCSVTAAAESGDANANARPVYVDRHFEPTGISAANDGRLFVNYPRWSDRYLNAVVVQTPE